MTAKKATARKAVKKAPAKRAAKKTAKKTTAKKAVKKRKPAPHRCPTPADWPDDQLLEELIRRGLNNSTSAAFVTTVGELADDDVIDDRHEALVALGLKVAAIMDLPSFVADPNAALVREFRTLNLDLIGASDEEDEPEGDDGLTEQERWQKILAGDGE